MKPTIHKKKNRSNARPRISSLLKNPANGKIPAIARVATAKLFAVFGIFSHNPPILRMSCSPDMA